jgi:hypothetical protein
MFTWGATREEAGRPMPGDGICQRPQLNATRAVTIVARPEEIWPWLVQWGWNRAGFYSYDLLDNLGRRSAGEILPQFQQLAVGDWVPMSGKPTPYTAFQVARLEPGKMMLWRKGGGTWLWLLEPVDGEHTRLITRMRGRYRWTRPTIVTELLLMEIGDPVMMRKCLRGIKQRAERLAAHRRRPAAADAGQRREASADSRGGRRRHDNEQIREAPNRRPPGHRDGTHAGQSRAHPGVVLYRVLHDVCAVRGRGQAHRSPRRHGRHGRRRRDLDLRGKRIPLPAHQAR